MIFLMCISGLWVNKYLDQLGFNLVGYGCTTCIGNSGPLDKNISDSIKKGNIPIIAPLGIDKEGNTYNINADTAAGFIAGSLKASKLLLLTDVAGILDQDKKLISSLSFENAKQIIDEKYILGGMKPKILTCIDAMAKGVSQATILDGRISHALILELFTEHGIGTQIYT